ncbi:MAG: alpha/beta hydrolase, partial [Acidobacteria bacterium]|nr:alpha/beta hydrolase [Acidobacteriota bacterium]
GGSPGSPAEAGLYIDGLAVYDHVRNAGVEPARIVLYGRSLGAAVAIQTALDRPARALVIESAFLSIPALARLHYPFVPSSLVRTQMDNEAKAHRIDVPTLVLHGGQDRTVPASHGKRLHAKLTARKRLHVVESAEHNDIRRQGGAAYADAWQAFLRETDQR